MGFGFGGSVIDRVLGFWDRAGGWVLGFGLGPEAGFWVLVRPLKTLVWGRLRPFMVYGPHAGPPLFPKRKPLWGALVNSGVLGDTQAELPN